MNDNRLALCWRNQDCRTCFTSSAGCGWCPYTSACVPANSLLDPIWNENICPHWAERWELRTKSLGCYCSTITLFTALITILCTIVGLIILYGLRRILYWLNRVWGTGSWDGTELRVDERQIRTRIWSRRSWFRTRKDYHRIPG